MQYYFIFNLISKLCSTLTFSFQSFSLLVSPKFMIMGLMLISICLTSVLLFFVTCCLFCGACAINSFLNELIDVCQFKSAIFFPSNSFLWVSPNYFNAIELTIIRGQSKYFHIAILCHITYIIFLCCFVSSNSNSALMKEYQIFFSQSQFFICCMLINCEQLFQSSAMILLAKYCCWTNPQKLPNYNRPFFEFRKLKSSFTNRLLLPVCNIINRRSFPAIIFNSEGNPSMKTWRLHAYTLF